MTPLAPADALPLIAAVLLGASVFAFARAMVVARGGEYARSRTRLEAIAVDSAPASEAAAVAARRRARGSEQTRALLRRAGLAWTPADYALVTLLSGLVAGGLALFATGVPLAAGAVGVLGSAVPTVIVRRRAAARADQFNSQVVEAIELVASSLRSGFGFMQSIELASREQPSPMAEELRQVIREVDLGMSVDEALERLVTRTGDADLELVVQAVLVQRRVGGDLGDVIGRIAAMIRDRIRVRGEIHTLTAQARMSAWIVGMLPLALAGVTAFLQPSQIAVLFTDPVGQLLLASALTLQVVGFILVRRVADIAY